MMAD
jgi:hypothetical protein